MTEDLGGEDTSSTHVVNVPPSVEIPPPPEQVARPSEPEVATTDVDPEATTAPTDFTEQKRRPETPKPPSVSSSTDGRPSFVPRDVDPRLESSESELREMLKQHYPPSMAGAGIGGRVVLWVFVDKDGEVAEVRIKELERAARTVAKQMTFEPAQSRDKPIGMWVTHGITFSPATAG